MASDITAYLSLYDYPIAHDDADKGRDHDEDQLFIMK
jgi:hypothetical protein